MDQNINKNSNDEKEDLGSILFKKREDNNFVVGVERDWVKGEEGGEGGEDREQKNNSISPVEVFAVKQRLLKMKKDIEELLEILEKDSSLKIYENKFINRLQARDEELYKSAKVTEGIFNGLQMVAKNGNEYDVPPNYASKSKLVEGDILKLRILENGRFIYKQIEQIKRKNATGKLLYYEDTNEYFVILENSRKYKVLPASITYYKAVPGDEIIIIIPESGESKWGAVESIKHKVGFSV